MRANTGGSAMSGSGVTAGMSDICDWLSACI